MSYKHVSILIVAAMIVAAIAWDLLTALAGRPNASWCQAVRDVNRASDGLLMWAGWVGVGIHIFCNQWFPLAWGGPK